MLLHLVLLVTLVYTAHGTSFLRNNINNHLRTMEDPVSFDNSSTMIPVFLEGRSKDIWNNVNMTTDEGSGFVIPVIEPLGPSTVMLPGMEEPTGVLNRWGRRRKRSLKKYNRINDKDMDPLMCGHYEMVGGESVKFTSPYYPEDYPSRFRCTWTFQLVTKGGFVVQCKDLQLIRKSYLQVDKLIYNKDTTDVGELYYESDKSFLLIYFASRRRSRSRGFSCVVSAFAHDDSTNATSEPQTTEEETTTTEILTTEKATPTTTQVELDLTTSTTLPTTTTPPLSYPDCGIANRATRIVNGQTASVHEYPWQTYLLVRWDDGKNQVCGGSLISDQWIITAGHCVLRQKDDKSLWLPDVEAVLGAHTRSDPTGDGGVKYKVSEIHIHPKNSFSHDLALIKIPEKAPINDKISPVCLPDHRMLDRNLTGAVVAVSGWGKTETGKLSDTLRELGRYAIEPKICQRVFGSYITDHHFCTSGADVKHICLGDSGGPVISLQNGRFFLVGVISFVATADCSGEYPDGHTSVIHFEDWIESVTNLEIY